MGWVYMRPTTSRWFQMWKYDATKGHVKNVKNNQVFGVHGNSDTENRNIHCYGPNTHLAQQFDVVLQREWEPEPKDGELNKRYGLIVNRPFYFISGLGSGKYLDMVNRNMVIKSRNGRNSQLWFFDQKSRTIKNYQHKGWSIDGRSTNMYAHNTSPGVWY
jgi:hypothetical protein